MPLTTYLTRLIWLCIAPLALLSAYLSIDYVVHEHDEFDAESERLTRNVAATIEHEVRARISGLQILAASPLAEDASLWRELHREAQAFRQRFGGDVVLLDLQRRAQFSTRVAFGASPPPLAQTKGRSPFQAALQSGQPEVGDVLDGPSPGEVNVGIVVPGVRQGRPAFTLAALIPVRDLQVQFDRLALPKGWSIALLDSTGAGIAGIGPAVRNGGSSTESNRRFASRLQGAPWSVVLEIPRAVYLAPMAQAALTLGIAMLGATLLGVLGGTWAARRLGNSLCALAGELPAGAQAANIAEIGALRVVLDESLGKRDAAQSELAHAQAELTESHTALQRLFAAQNRVQESERRRIARELHDEMQQKLAAISINVAAIGARTRDSPEIAKVLAEIDELTASVIASTRRIVSDLRPQILEDLGLVPALEALAQQFSQRNGIACRFDAQGDALTRLPELPALTTCLYRVAQEALNNAAKHSRATRVWVSLADAHGGRIALRVVDNGDGLRAADRRKPGSFGLAGMQERVREVGGEFLVRSEPGAGTSIEVRAPLVPSPKPARRAGDAAEPADVG